MYTLKEIDWIIEKSILNMDIGGDPQSLYNPIEYMISIGGKRVRPRLCIITFSLFSDNINKSIVYPALALEIFHGFTLIHDDIMDKAETRRNQPTVHKKWGENCAILSGDVMSIMAYRYLAAYTGDKLSQVLELFSTTAAQVCEGQQYDMDYEKMPFITNADYLNMIGLKTGALLACSAKMGAIIGGASNEISDALYKYGFLLGIAFQITDDYLDTFGNAQIFGKKIGGDILNNKKSWLLVESLRLATEENKNRLSHIMEMGEDSAAEKIEQMKNLYIDLGIKDNALNVILEYQRKAMDAVSNVGLKENQLEKLKEFSEQIIYREK